VQIKEGRLTNKKYWTDYYKESALDKDLIIKICGKYDFFWDKLIDSTAERAETVLEVGAYPGRYLAYLASKFKLTPTGMDFNPDANTVYGAFQTMGVENGSYIEVDFLKIQPEAKYDLIISIGFIEHFDNYEEVLDKHAHFLKPGGAILLMIPNKRYFRKWYGYLLDYANLKAHNLSSMTLETFNDFADRKALKMEHLSYQGGFAYKVHQPLSFIQKLVYHPVRYISLKMNKILSNYPSKLWSGTIIAILSKPN
jgi:cyclopropane fatty-acyl-phospholipid synthase-like methyltransferase